MCSATSGVQLGSYDTVSHAAAFGAHGYRVNSLTEPGVSISDVPVGYRHSIDLATHLHDDAFPPSRDE